MSDGPGDGTGRTWQEYMRDIRDARTEVSTDNEPGSVEILVTRAAAEEDYSDARSVKGYLSAAHKAGFKTLVGYSEAFHPGHIIKTGDSAGEWTPDKRIKQVWVSGHKENYGIFKITYTKTDDSKWSCVSRIRNNQLTLVGDKDMKDWIADGS